MTATPFGVLKALFMLALMVLLQTTFFRTVRPFGVAPDLVMLVVILAARWLPAEQALVYGFTAGIVMDLLGTTPLGLRGLVLTVVAYLVVRFRDWVEASPLATLVSVAAFSAVGVGLLLVIGTLFGQATLAEANVLRRFLLVPFWNTILALALAPAMTSLLNPVQRSRVGAGTP